jgi:hypothetical protein
MIYLLLQVRVSRTAGLLTFKFAQAAQKVQMQGGTP